MKGSRWTAWPLVLGMLAGGCAWSPVRDGPLTAMEAEVGESAASGEQQAVPEEVTEALLPPITLGAEQALPEPEGGRFDISVDQVPAREFFLGLVEGTHYNMVVHPEVTGTISLQLRSVTIPEVLEAVRDVYGYQFVRTSYGFQVLPARLQARVYQIDYLNMRRQGASATFVSAGTLQEVPGIDTAEAEGGQDDSGAVVTSGGGRGQRSVVGTQVSTVQPATSFWDELKAALTAIVGPGEGRSVVVNPQAGVVVVRAIPNELREVEAFLRATQLIAHRQVILEAKILEVELDESFQTGINWAGLFGDYTIGMTGGGTNLVNESGLSDIAGQTGDLNPDPNLFSPIDGTLASAFGGVFSVAVAASDFSAFIELLKTQGNVQVLSSPRIATMNNQKAVIKVGTDEFFVTDISTTTITGTATTSTPNIELTPFFSGIALDVTPQISGDGEVTLHIHPVVSNVVDQQKTLSISGVTQTLPLARSTVRESDSIVRARNGQLVVIGGLMQDRIRDDEAKAPGLGDLPWLGHLFKQQRRTSLKSELVILLRPIVAQTPEQWRGAVRQAAGGMQRMREELERWRARHGGAHNGE